MKAVIWMTTAFFVVLMTGTADAQVAPIPDGVLSIAYRQLQDGKLSQAVFQNHLRCFRGQCSLLVLTLNMCFGSKFYPKIQDLATGPEGGWDGPLSVRFSAPDVLVVEHPLAGAWFQLRLTFSQFRSPIDGRLHLGKVTKFSGGVVKDSDILGKVITWQLVPLDFWQANETKLDCPAVLLDGLPAEP